ncbi:MAG: SPOR domain-containing protein [Mediterranea sp.]|jgi:hypothetical protein|nr:SPOR domain-containing protein [Mediterranea sp.]
MINLARHIETLLLENDCVIVPGFGGFIAHYLPATHVEEENLFLPPTRVIGFNPQLKLNDGVLAQSYMSAYATSFADANHRIDKAVDELIALLHREGKASLENIGEIHYDIHGNYAFGAYENKLTTPSLYGLDAFEMKELSALPQRTADTAAPIHSRPTRQKRTYEIRINRTLLRGTVAAVAAILLFFAFPTRIQNTQIEPHSYAQLLPGELFATTQPQQKKVESATQPEKAEQAEVEYPRPQISRPQPVQATQVVAPKPYHIIVAAGIGKQKAEALASQLQAAGHDEAQVLQSETKIRVAIRSFADRDEAIKALMELRKQADFQSAWLLTD